MSLQIKQSLFAKNVGILINYIYSLDMACTFGDAFRSIEQAELNASKGIGIKDSLHCKRLAIDLNLFDSAGNYISSISDDYKKIGSFWKNLHEGNRWGGDFKRVDLNHFEMLE
jgi:hypothetical protein